MKSRLALLAIVGSLSVATSARADDKYACATAAEHAQALRDGAKLRAALTELISCSRPTCPAIVQQDCAKWAMELRAEMPTLILRARDGRGRDVAGVRVLVDGAMLVPRLEGTAVGMDPGAHHLRFEAASGAVKELDLVVAEAEKRRSVAVTFDVPLEVDGTAPRIEAPPPPVVPRRSRLPLYVSGGVGVVALASFAFFEARGQSDYHDLRDGCARNHSCRQADVDTAQTKLTVGVVSLGAAVVAAGAFTWFLLRGEPDRATASIELPRLTW